MGISGRLPHFGHTAHVLWGYGRSKPDAAGCPMKQGLVCHVCFRAILQFRAAASCRSKLVPGTGGAVPAAPGAAVGAAGAGADAGPRRGPLAAAPVRQPTGPRTPAAATGGRWRADPDRRRLRRPGRRESAERHPVPAAGHTHRRFVCTYSASAIALPSCSVVALPPMSGVRSSGWVSTFSMARTMT